VLSGGVSMGRFDFIPQVLGELGVKIVFHKIAQRPGKPMWFGIAPGGQAVYALPGNPVSTLVCLTRYVFAGLDAAAAAAPRPVESIQLTREFDVKPPMTFFLPVKIAPGAASAAPAPTRGSGDFTSLIGTDGFVELPPGPKVIPCGTPVPLYRW
jgi:molybdopterin molybdotransferase